jgi:hypothetical protein
MTTIGGYEVHPAADLFPLMDDGELEILANDIRKRGLQEPVTWDKDRKILDGRNRLRAIDLAGVNFKIEVKTYDGDDPVGFVTSANLFRRHLTPEQKGDLLIKLIAMQPKKSNRQIAKQAKVDHKTVAKARRKGEDVGTIPHVAKRTDTKNRQQPSSKAKAKPKPTPQIPIPATGKASASYLREFKTACDTWLPRLDAAELSKAFAYCHDKVIALAALRANGSAEKRVTGSAEISEDERRAEMEKLAKAES